MNPFFESMLLNCLYPERQERKPMSYRTRAAIGLVICSLIFGGQYVWNQWPNPSPEAVALAKSVESCEGWHLGTWAGDIVNNKLDIRLRHGCFNSVCVAAPSSNSDYVTFGWVDGWYLRAPHQRAVAYLREKDNRERREVERKKLQPLLDCNVEEGQ